MDCCYLSAISFGSNSVEGFSRLSRFWLASFSIARCSRWSVGRKADSVSHALAKAHGFILGAGLMGFTPQFVTAFPIVAGMLIFLAYRYLGIPARPIQ